MKKVINEILCVVLGDPRGQYVIEKSKPFQLPPPTEVIGD